MDKSDIFTFKRCVIEELVAEFGMTESDATKAFKQSAVYKMLKQSPEFIMHYSIQINAKEVYNEYMGIPLEM